jgi:hypothetical protein
MICWWDQAFEMFSRQFSYFSLGFEALLLYCVENLTADLGVVIVHSAVWLVDYRAKAR